ncbi:hypothetical protein D1631_11975 [Chryseobacterium nematophagum]|uniref:Fibrobacter succinogenes major paralogous domain-containing protein n=1 Tax=Chryseobacterium nematophagum TaxID=2305228 RepID=A0A3M7TK72_9FLAO|nr:FISUMP domain-containing protein [Chryseobacterium nematophagum]RNA62600.1 hypothetical protein D1631_11975 [Chryseobacterium nematophagum]
MKKTNLLVSMLLGVSIFGQVGINNSSPKVTLDVTAKNSDGSTSEGFIAPRLTGNTLFAAIALGTYGPDQNGTIVFVTESADIGNQVGQTVRVDIPAYYYFDSTSNQWRKMGTDSDFYNADGTLSSTRHVTMNNHNLTFMGGRIGMGTFTPDPSAILDLTSTNNGFLTPRMLEAEMNAISNPAQGLVIFCTDCFNNLGCLMINDSNNPAVPDWESLCTSNMPIGHVDNLSCGSATTSGTLQSGVAASGVSVTVPYTGGNGGAHPSAAFNSTGITGLSATLAGGTLMDGNGDFTFTISGTPSAAGTATFSITIAGQTCSFTVDVDAFTGNVASIDCANAVFSPTTITQGEDYTGTLTIPYTGGNGEPYPQLSFTQKGLTFTLPAGTLATGNGNFVYDVTGLAIASGAMTIPISFGGTSCNVNATIATATTVEMCSGVGQTQVWALYNLGADESFDPHIPLQEIHGNYYQWGRNTVVANASTGAGAIGGWNTTIAPNSSWNTGTEEAPVKNTTNDPCPAGFRVPTNAEWVALSNNSNVSRIGLFVGGVSSFDSALVFTCGTKKLTLPATGYRASTNGSLNNRGSQGAYWSSTERSINATQSMYLRFDSNIMNSAMYNNRANGYSVRCVAE